MKKNEELYYQLKKRALSGQPGSPFLSMRAIMNDYCVSQATVTKATQRLLEEGLLKKNAGREMEVTCEILKYAENARPVYCLALPLWQSEWYTRIEHEFFKLSTMLGFELETMRYKWEERVPKSLPKTKIDAVILVSDGDVLAVDDIRSMDNFRIPYVLFSRNLSGIAVNCVATDNEYTGAMAAHHLIDLGHRSLGLVISQPKTEIIMERVKGFRQFGELHGVKVTTIDCGIKNGEFGPAKVFDTVSSLLAEGRPGFSALFTMCEDSAFTLYRVFSDHGLRIPEDLSLICVGDSWRLDYYTPSMTSIGGSVTELVTETDHLLKRILEHPDRKSFSRRLVKAYLAKRGSTAQYKGE